jgi:hypothetical protein
MRADYDSTANAISIGISEAPHADSSDEVHPRAIAAMAEGKPSRYSSFIPTLGSTSRSPLWPTATSSTSKP